MKMPAVMAALDPDRFFRARQRSDGDPFVVWMPGLGDVVFTGHPDGARDIFRAPVDTLAPPLPNPIAPLVGDASLILLGGPRHKRERGLLMPAFHRARLQEYAEIIAAATTARLRDWNPGAVVDSRAAAADITMQVILEAVFGVHDAARRGEYTRVITDFLAAYSAPLMLAPVLRRGPGPWASFVRRRAAFDRLLDAELLRDTDGTSILSLLRSARYEDGSTITQADLRDELRTLLVAGHETTATALCWALFHLAGTPPPADAGPRIWEAVAKETLRLHPTVPIVLRRLLEPLSVRDRPVPAGGVVGVSLHLLHRHPDTWDAPAEFRPERFLERKYTPFEYAPFGGGYRRCIGFGLAELELQVALQTIHATVRLERLDQREPVAVPRGIAASPRNPIRFRVTHRRQT